MSYLTKISFTNITSIIYRICIIIYSLFLVYNLPINFIYNIILALVYLYISYLFIKFNNKSKWISRTRLLTDFIYMFLVIYINNLEPNYLLYFYLLIPFINLLNHSSKVLNPLISIVNVTLPFSFLAYYVYSIDYIKLYFLPLLVISILYFLAYSKISIISYSNSLNSIFQTFYRDKFTTKSTHHILKKLIFEHNKSENIFVNRLKINNVIIFKVSKRGNIKLLLGSDFISYYLIDDPQILLDKLSTNLYIKNHQFIYNLTSSKTNIFINITVSNNSYILAIDLKQTFSYNFILDIYISKFLLPFFNKLIDVIDYEYSLGLERKRQIIEISKDLQLTQGIINSVHYLNNKLNPVVTYFDLKKNQKFVSEEFREDYDKLILASEKKASRIIVPVIQKMRRMLSTHSKNSLYDTEIISFKRLFSIIRDVFNEEEYLSLIVEENPTFNFDDKLLCNSETLSYAIEEIIINLSKYSDGKCVVNFAQYEDFAIVTFTNRFHNKQKSSSELAEIIKLFNKDGINEILRKNNHGLRIIKEYFTLNNISHNILIEDEYFILKLKIKKHII